MRPRVCVCAGGIARLLEEEVEALLAKPGRAVVWLVGPSGSGKSAALAHLAAVFAGQARLRLWDGEPFVPGDDAVDVKAVATATGLREVRGALVWSMAPWSDDECLEYLQSRHPARVAAAMTRWRATPAGHDLLAWPGVLGEVLDELASDAAPADGLQAVRRLLARATRGAGDGPAKLALAGFQRGEEGHATVVEPRVRDLLRSRTALALLAAERLVAFALAEDPFELETLVWERTLAIALMVVVQEDAASAARLVAAVQTEAVADRRLALSVLAVAHTGFRPGMPRLLDVGHAMLACTDLRAKVLQGNCNHVHLAHANLQWATLDGCRLFRAALTGADLGDATMRSAFCAKVSAQGLQAQRVDAAGACFTGALLTDAVLRGAQLERADLSTARLQGADLSMADLTGADLSHTDLTTTNLAGARLRNTKLVDVQAAGLVVPQLLATGADWSRADLTASQLRGARLQCGRFRGCRLAHIDWQGADLRGADFTGATFHLGNARSGLVGSDLASEGSRTGFYTDESLEDHFKEPEQVRKANLQDCDLRGARLDGVDLYLVDLRGARLEAGQRAWAKRCRALLDAEGAA